MTGIRTVALHQTIRDQIDAPMTDDQVEEIAARCYEYDGTLMQESVTPEQFWEVVEDVLERMTPAELRSVRECIGYSIEDLARGLSVSRSIVQKWEAGSSPVPVGVAATMRDWLHEYMVALGDATGVVEVWSGRDDAASWEATGRPSRWHRQIAAHALADGARITYRT